MSDMQAALGCSQLKRYDAFLRRRRVLSRSELRLLSTLAVRAALALENHLYQREVITSERMAALGRMASMLAHDTAKHIDMLRFIRANTRPPRQETRGR